MYALANCRVSVLRGTTDNFGDEVDDSTVHASGVLANITQTSLNTFDAVSQTTHTVRALRGSLPSATDVRIGDRLKVEPDGPIYSINSVSDDSGPGWTADIRLELERTTS